VAWTRAIRAWSELLWEGRDALRGDGGSDRQIGNGEIGNGNGGQTKE
jgi:hypothetical protein